MTEDHDSTTNAKVNAERLETKVYDWLLRDIIIDLYRTGDDQTKARIEEAIKRAEIETVAAYRRERRWAREALRKL